MGVPFQQTTRARVADRQQLEQANQEVVFLAPPQRARPENTTTYLIHTSKITCSACVGRTTPRSRLLPLLPPAKPARKRAAWQPVDAYRDLCFHGSPRWRCLRAGGRRSFTIERVLSSSARKVSTTAQADTQRTRGTLQHSADTTAAPGEGAASSPERACSNQVSLVNALSGGPTARCRSV